jgi:PadR family transcriptional regulator, regulatory protein PadR
MGALPRDWLVACVLLRVREGGASGSDLLEEMRNLGFGSVRPGEMYRTLRELEREALVFCEGRGAEFMLSRRRYAITTLGEAYLELLANVLAQYRGEVERFFRLYERAPLQRVPG